jgi:hypothetical protein
MSVHQSSNLRVTCLAGYVSAGSGHQPLSNNPIISAKINGAGQKSHSLLPSLGIFTHRVRNGTLDSQSTASRTRLEVREGLVSAESRSLPVPDVYNRKPLPNTDDGVPHCATAATPVSRECFFIECRALIIAYLAHCCTVCAFGETVVLRHCVPLSSRHLQMS